MAKEVPVLVKVLAVLGYIGAALMLIGGIAMFVGAGAIASYLSGIIPFLGAIGAGLFIVVGIFLVLLAVLYFFIARGLWKGQNWARIVMIVLSFLGVLFALFGLPATIISLIINLAIALYLLLAKDVKAAFA